MSLLMWPREGGWNMNNGVDQVVPKPKDYCSRTHQIPHTLVALWSIAKEKLSKFFSMLLLLMTMKPLADPWCHQNSYHILQFVCSECKAEMLGQGELRDPELATYAIAQFSSHEKLARGHNKSRGRHQHVAIFSKWSNVFRLFFIPVLSARETPARILRITPRAISAAIYKNVNTPENPKKDPRGDNDKAVQNAYIMTFPRDRDQSLVSGVIYTRRDSRQEARWGPSPPTNAIWRKHTSCCHAPIYTSFDF